MCKKSFVKAGDQILLTGITNNPNFVVFIDTVQLLNGIQLFPCSIKGVDYQLTMNDVEKALSMATEEEYRDDN